MSDVVIKRGDVFDWQPYGTPGWPHATALGITVVRLTYPDENSPTGIDEMESTADLCVDDDPSEVRVYTKDRAGCVAWNSLDHFLEMVEKKP